MPPIRAVIVQPKDYVLPAGTAPYMCRVKVVSWINRLKTYLRQEAGVTCDFTLTYHFCKYTHLELATENNGTVHLDQYGQGIDEGQIWWRCFREELAYPVNEPYRWTAFVWGAGGWAGGRNELPTNDVGTALIGHWNLAANTGQKESDPACAAYHGASSDVCRADGDGWSHEMLHLFGVECHNPSTYPFKGQGLNIDQKLALLEKNRPFLRDA